MIIQGSPQSPDPKTSHPHDAQLQIARVVDHIAGFRQSSAISLIPQPKILCHDCHRALYLSGLRSQSNVLGTSFAYLQCQCGCTPKEPQWLQIKATQILPIVDHLGWECELPYARDSIPERFRPWLASRAVRSRLSQSFYRIRHTTIPEHTYRAGQHAMATLVYLTLQQQAILLANAGVGIGKTLGYGVPLVEWLRDRPTSTVVLSTQTLLLQDQLEADLARIQTSLGTTIPMLAAKGREQYLCLDRLETVQGELPAILDTVRQVLKHPTSQGFERLQSLKHWNRRQWSAISDPVWDTVRVTPQSPCSGCIWANACAFQTMRQARDTFQGILIVTHGTLANDLVQRAHGDLPLWQDLAAVVIDEAQGLEGALRNRLTVRTTLDDLHAWIIDQSLGSAYADTFVDALSQAIAASRSATASHTRPSTVTLSPTVRAQLALLFRTYRPKSIRSITHGDPTAIILERLHTMVMRSDTQDSWILWAQQDSQIGIGPIALDAVLHPLTRHATIFTSGTLGIGADTTWWERSLGIDRLPETPVARLYAPSPFDYPQQLQYYHVPDLPHPATDRSRGPQARANRIARTIQAIRRHTPSDHKILVLFTAKSMMTAVHQRLCTIGDADALTDSDAAWIERFKAASNPVALSTSAWEGFDVPGPKTVIIVQLPYPVTSDPRYQAILRLMSPGNKAQTLQTWMQTRLIQGVGRAIRTTTDKSAVFFLDPRVASQYARIIQPILPSAPIYTIQNPTGQWEPTAFHPRRVTDR